MASMNGLDRPSRLSQPDGLDEARLRDALGELMVEATDYRDGRGSVQDLNAALERAQGALDRHSEHGAAHDRIRP